MATNRHDAVFVAADVTPRQREIENRLNPIPAKRVLGDAHAPDENGIFCIADEFGEFLHGRAVETRVFLQRLPVHRRQVGLQFLESRRVLVNEVLVNPSLGEEDFHHAREEGDVAALAYGEPVIGDVRSKERGVGIGWHPILFHAGLEVGIHQNNFRSEFFGFVQIFCGNRLVVGGIRAEKNDKVGPIPILVAAGRRGHAERLLHRRARWRVANAGRIVDMVRAKESGRLLGHVIDFIRHATRSHKKCHSAGIGRPQFGSEALIRLIPRNATKPRRALFADHRIRQASQFPQLSVVHFFQLRDIGKKSLIERRDRVQTQKIEARHAKMRSLHGPIMQARHAERATIAHAASDHFPRVGKVVPVFPNNMEHVAKVLRFGKADAERQATLEFLTEISANGVGCFHHIKAATKNTLSSLIQIKGLSDVKNQNSS